MKQSCSEPNVASGSDAPLTVTGLAKAGPCPGDQKLELFSALDKHEAVLRTAASRSDLKAKGEARDDINHLPLSLAASCETAVSDVASAMHAIKSEAEEKTESSSRAR